MARFVGFIMKLLGTLTLLGVLLGGVGLLTAGYWLPKDDVPGIADAIVVLGGDYTRPMYAADLYRRGFADTIYIPRVNRGRWDRIEAENGFAVPRQEEVYHRILTNNSVPPAAIRMYGRDVLSTIQEAESLAKKLGKGPGRLVLVTSPYHVTRTRMIFSDLLPGWTVMVCATPYDKIPEKWWQSQLSARTVILESTKILYYLLGGAFRSSSGAAG